MAEDNSSPQEYMYLSDCVKQWNMPVERIKQFCEENKIIGAAKINGNWIIPIDAKKPF